MYKKILIPTDGSPVSTEAALAAVEFARQISAEIAGVFVAPKYQYPIYFEMTPVSSLTEDEYTVAVQKSGEIYLEPVQKAAAEANLKFFSVTVFSDNAARQIVQTAEEHACDLIFMGSHGRSGWGQLLLGSVTSKVLSLCKIPVLVYRSDRKSAAHC